MAERIPDSLIDEILASAKSYGEAEQPVADYGADEIDKLIAEISADGKSEIGAETSANEKPVFVKEEAEKTSFADAASENKERFSLDLSKLNSLDAAEEEFAEDTVSDADVSLLVDDDGQIGLAADGVEIGGEEEAENTPEQPAEEGVKSVSGQISIEKTRLFNEVKIHGEYNPSIPHNLGNKVTRTTTGEAEPLSTPGMSEEKYRKHFMNKPVQNIEKTQEHRKVIASMPEKTIETPGVVIKKNKDLKTSTDGIQPLPTLVPAEYELEQEKTRLDLPKASGSEDIADNQIVLEGFNDEEPVLQQSEEQAEAELKRNRKNVVDEFVNNGLLFKQEVEEQDKKNHFERQSVSVAREYFGPKDRPAIEKIYMSEKRGLVSKTVILSVICGIMALLAAAAGADNGNFELYNNNEYIYVAVQLVLLIIACAINFRSFINTFKGLKNKTVDMDTVVCVAALAGFIQCAVGFAFTDNVEATAHILAGAAVIPMILKTAGELVRCKNDYDNFLLVSDDEKLCYSVENIDDEETANEIARGLMLGDPDIKYSAKTDFPANFVAISRSSEVTGKLIRISVPAICGVAVLAGAAYGIVSKNLFAAVSTFAGVILMGLPAAAGLLSAVNLRAANKKLNAEGTLINGYSAVEDAVNSNGVVIDACDAFVSGGCNIEGIKLYHKMRIDEAIQYTASVIIASGGVLSDVFDGVIIGKKELLFPVESLSYEEKLGCSCWIHNHRVLVGNRELLVHHNVETPDAELEEKFKKDGRNVIYLAIEGKISAMFVVVYKANEVTAKYMRELEKDGLTIFFRTSDANITEEFIENEFGLPSDVVKIINPVAGEMFQKVKNRVSERTNANIIHDGTVKTMLSALHAAFGINNFVNITRIVQLAEAVIGAAVVVLLAFLSGLAQVGVWQIIIYQALWTLILSLLPTLRKK